MLAAHSTVPVVIILEPDALPNLVTNRGWQHFWLNEGWTIFVQVK